MNRNRLEEALRTLVGEVHPEDGVDPALLKRNRSGKRVKPRKVAALCKQIERAIAFSIPARLDVGLIAVTPGADPSSVVAIFQRGPGCKLSLSEVEEQLTALAPQFREEAASSITRKRVPDIQIQVSPEIA